MVLHMKAKHLCAYLQSLLSSPDCNNNVAVPYLIVPIADSAQGLWRGSFATAGSELTPQSRTAFRISGALSEATL